MHFHTITIFRLLFSFCFQLFYPLSSSLCDETSCWETIESASLFCAVFSPQAFFSFVTQRDMSCHMVHSLQQTQGHKGLLTFLSLSFCIPVLALRQRWETAFFYDGICFCRYISKQQHSYPGF